MDKEQIPISVPKTKRIVVTRTPSMKDTFPGRLEWKKKHYDKPVTSTPVASTSKSSMSSKTTTMSKNDVESCFGFDDSADGDENYSILISPILREKDKDKVRVEQSKNIVHFKRIPPMPKFNDLLDRYTHDEHQGDDGDLHVNLKGIKATYSKKDVHFAAPVEIDNDEEEKVVTRVTRSKSKSKSSTTTNTVTKRATNTVTKRSKKSKEKEVVPSKAVVHHVSKKTMENDADMEKWVAKKNKEFEDISNFPLVLEKTP